MLSTAIVARLSATRAYDIGVLSRLYRTPSATVNMPNLPEVTDEVARHPLGRYLGRRATEGADDDDEPTPEEMQPASPSPPTEEDGQSAPTPEQTAAMISRMSLMSASIIRRCVRLLITGVRSPTYI